MFGGSELAIVGVSVGILHFLANNLQAIYYRLVRRWGGRAKRDRIWDDFTVARARIQRDRHIHHDEKGQMIVDLRNEYKERVPAWAHLF